MAATIVAGVCEDHQDYELMAPSRKGYPKRGKTVFLRLTKLISTILNLSQAFSSPLVRPYSRPILQVANVQEFFSLKMSYDVFLCFTSMSYHRHAENVLSKVDIACGQFVLYRVIMLHPRSDGAPQKCQWMPLCSVALSPHVLSLAKYLSMAFEKIHKIPIPPTANTTY